MSGLYARLVVLIGAVALLILTSAVVILRANSAGAAAEQVARSLRAQTVLADTLLTEASLSPQRTDALLLELDVRRRATAPEARGMHVRFWDGVARELSDALPGREVRFDGSRDPVMWVSRRAPSTEWIGIPVAPLRSEVSRSVAITAFTACLIVLIAAAAYARGLTRPLRQLAEAASEIAAGRSAPPLAASAAREFHALQTALNAAADGVRASASDRSLMLAALSHDMRTPLARLRLASELVEMDPQARDDMHQDIEELDRLIGDCIDFARDGRDEPVESFDAVAMLADLIATQQRSGLEWSLEAPERAVIAGRPMALRRAVANLMENAGHHGSAPFSVQCRIDAAHLAITVLDRGPGVPTSMIEKLGTPFLQGAPTRAAGRSGLGLASARRVATQHDGTLRLSNRAGGGFAAVLTIPSSTSRSGS